MSLSRHHTHDLGLLYFRGVFDVFHVFEWGKPDLVRDALWNVIEVAAPGGGFVLSTADSVWDEGAYDNVMAFIEAGLEYGR